MNIQAIKSMIKPLSAMIPGFSMDKIIPQITEGITALETRIGAKPFMVLTVESGTPVVTVYKQSESGGLDIAFTPYQINSIDDIFKIFENLQNNAHIAPQPTAPRLAASPDTNTGNDTDDLDRSGFELRAENYPAFD